MITVFRERAQGEVTAESSYSVLEHQLRAEVPASKTEHQSSPPLSVSVVTRPRHQTSQSLPLQGYLLHISIKGCFQKVSRKTYFKAKNTFF